MPKITVNCSHLTELKRRESFACECTATNGSPPADVTWFKNNTKIVTRREEAILVLSDVDKEDSGTYICEAKRHEGAKNTTSIELIVNCKYDI